MSVWKCTFSSKAELSARDERRVRTSLRLSGLPTGQTLGNFDFAFQPSVERTRIETLATCAWICERESLLPPGATRCRQDDLAVALAVRAVENGFSVAFHRLEDLLAALKRDAEGHPARLRQRKHAAGDVENAAAVQQAIEDRGRQHLVPGEHCGPLGDALS